MNSTGPARALGPMEPTGERTVPGFAVEQYFFARHEIVYLWAREYIAAEVAGTCMDRATVLDAGSGEGYGAALLAESDAHLVVAVEYDTQACHHAVLRYHQPSFVQANLAHLPLQGESIDVVVSLQVIEHLWDLPGFLVDLRTITRPGGLLIASTPNREVFSPGLGRGQRPVNPFHVEEFDAEQVIALLEDAGWADVQMFGLHHGERIQQWEAVHGSILTAQVAAMTTDTWPEDLADFVSGITASDFVIAPLPGPPSATAVEQTGHARGSDVQDLIALARAPELTH